MKIRVPATTANLGSGFDSFGLALNLYLEIEVLEPSTEWEITHLIEGLPTDSSNLIIETAQSISPNLQPHKLKMRTNIPTARGLGSSSSAIVAGIELANQIGHLGLSNSQKVTIASDIEGHPDNVAPAILGDFVVSTVIDGKTYYNRHKFPDCEIIAIIPNYELLTSTSRNALPNEVTFSYGIEAANIGHMALSYLLDNKIEEAAFLMEKDKWHEPFRKHLVKELQQVRDLKEELGFYTALLSGAGPTILVLADKKNNSQLQETLGDLFDDCKVKKLKVDIKGVTVSA